MAAPRVGEQLVVQDPLEGPEQDSGQVALPIHPQSDLQLVKSDPPAHCPQKV